MVQSANIVDQLVVPDSSLLHHSCHCSNTHLDMLQDWLLSLADFSKSVYWETLSSNVHLQNDDITRLEYEIYMHPDIIATFSRLMHT